MKKKDLFISMQLTPALICFLALFAYPLFRTVLMSFHVLPSISSSMSDWEFVGLKNYIELFRSGIFIASMKNVGMIWLAGGFLTLGIAVFFAAILASGVIGKKFWRSAIYIPNTINAVALSTMWIQYIYQNKFGMLKKVPTVLGLGSLAAINWTSPQFLFCAMLISYVFGSTGYFMLIFLSGMEQIPKDLYESAQLDGSNSWTTFWRITFPLLGNVTRTCITIYTVGAVNFFTWSKMFSAKPNTATITPVYLLYNRVFGATNGATTLDVGSGAAIGVIVALLVLFIYLLLNKVWKTEGIEY